MTNPNAPGPRMPKNADAVIRFQMAFPPLLTRQLASRSSGDTMKVFAQDETRLGLEAVWKQSLYTRRGYVIYRARLRTDLLDNWPLDMLLEISKRLIY